MDKYKKLTPPSFSRIIKEDEKLLTKIISLKYKRKERLRELSIITNSKTYKAWQIYNKLKKFFLLIPRRLLFGLPVAIL